MKLKCLLYPIFCSLILTACAPMQPRLSELPIPPSRLVQKGYSLMPPNEKGWLVAGRNEYQLALVKGGSNPDETTAIQAMPFRIMNFETTDELVRLIKDGQAKDTDPQRFSIKKHEVVAYVKKGVNCAKSHMITEDKAAVKRTGKSGFMILEALTLTCAHPENRNMAINVTYSHRYYPEHRNVSFIDQALNILNSIEFSDI